MHPRMVRALLELDAFMKAHNRRRAEVEAEAAAIARQLHETNRRAKRINAEMEHRGRESQAKLLRDLRRDLLSMD